eukprot:403346518
MNQENKSQNQSSSRQDSYLTQEDVNNSQEKLRNVNQDNSIQQTAYQSLKTLRNNQEQQNLLQNDQHNPIMQSFQKKFILNKNNRNGMDTKMDAIKVNLRGKIRDPQIIQNSKDLSESEISIVEIGPPNENNDQSAQQIYQNDHQATSSQKNSNRNQIMGSITQNTSNLLIPGQIQIYFQDQIEKE